MPSIGILAFELKKYLALGEEMLDFLQTQGLESTAMPSHREKQGGCYGAGCPFKVK
jgi:hypothetical protein